MRALCLAMLLMALPGTVLAEGAAPPPTGGGRIDLGGGWRWLGPGSGPFGLGRFTYQWDAHWSMGLEFGITSARTRFSSGEASVVLADLDAVVAYQLNLGRVHPFVLGGVGYQFVGVREGDEYHEGNTGAYFAGIGVYIPLTARIGVLLEDRWTFAKIEVEVGGELQRFDVGGNRLWAGIVIAFDPDPPLAR